MYNDHPENCIICGTPSGGEIQCENCLIQSKNFSMALDTKKCFQRWKKVNSLFEKTLKNALHALNHLDLDKEHSLCNQLIGIGLFANIHYPDAINEDDLLNKAYELTCRICIK